MSLDHQLDPDNDETAPLTRSQRNATLVLPACLVLSALHVWDGLTGPAELPGLIVVTWILTFLIGGAVGLVWISEGEKRDEREKLIELKAMRIGLVVLIIGNVLVLPRAASQLHEAIWALLLFSWAVTSAATLFYSRQSARLG